MKLKPGSMGLKDERPERPTAGDVSKLPKIFSEFLLLERQGRSVNQQKAELFANAKRDDLDPGALRAAFRQRVREMENPEVTTKHDELTDSYLVALRGSDSDDGSSTSLQAAQSIVPVAASPGRHTRTREMGTTPEGGHVGTSLAEGVETGSVSGEETASL